MARGEAETVRGVIWECEVGAAAVNPGGYRWCR